MNEPRESRPIRPECERRITSLEVLLSNHIPHIEARLNEAKEAREEIQSEMKEEMKGIKKLLWGIIGTVGVEIVGLLFYLLKMRVT